MQLEITNKGYPIYYLDSAAFITRKSAQTLQISFNADSITVRHAEKFYTAGVMSSGFLAINSADYRHSWTYSFSIVLKFDKKQTYKLFDLLTNTRTCNFVALLEKGHVRQSHNLIRPMQVSVSRKIPMVFIWKPVCCIGEHLRDISEC